MYIFTVKKYYCSGIPRARINVSIISERAARAASRARIFGTRWNSFACTSTNVGVFFFPPRNERAPENPKLAPSGAVCLNKSKRVSKVFRFLSGTSHMHRTINARARAISDRKKIDGGRLRAATPAEDNPTR